MNRKVSWLVLVAMIFALYPYWRGAAAVPPHCGLQNS